MEWNVRGKPGFLAHQWEKILHCCQQINHRRLESKGMRGRPPTHPGAAFRMFCTPALLCGPLHYRSMKAWIRVSACHKPFSSPNKEARWAVAAGTQQSRPWERRPLRPKQDHEESCYPGKDKSLINQPFFSVKYIYSHTYHTEV